MTTSPKPMPSYSEAFASAAAASASENWREKLSLDVKQWAELWRRPVTIALILRLVLLEPGFQVVFSVRLQEALSGIPIMGRWLRRVLWYCTCVWHGCEIAPAATIGGGLVLPHPHGVVIGGHCVLGKRVRILQGVTLGERGLDPGGDTIDRRSPCVGDDVRVFAGACVTGPISLGAGCVVGANAVVLQGVPAGWAAVGVPARNLPPKALREMTAGPAET